MADTICRSSFCAAAARGLIAVLFIAGAGALSSAPLAAKEAYGSATPLAGIKEPVSSRCHERLAKRNPLYEELGFGGLPKLTRNRTSLAGTALISIRTFSRLIAESFGLQHYHRRFEQVAASKVQQLARAAENAFDSPATAIWGLSNLAIICHAQGNTSGAIALLERALTAAGDKASAARILHNLSMLYARQRRYSEAAAMALSSLSLMSGETEQDQSRVFEVLSTLGGAYYAQGRYGDAELAVLRACAIAAGKFKATDVRLSRAIANLAVIYKAQGRALEAIAMFGRALSAAEAAVGPDDIWAGRIANRLAVTYMEEGMAAESELLFKRAIGIAEKNAAEESLFLSAALFNLSALYARQERYEEAEALLQRSLTIRLTSYGAGHPAVEEVQNALSAVEGVMHSEGRRDTQIREEASTERGTGER